MRFLFASIVTLVLAVPSSARDLHWKSLDVDARLDNDGRLHVTERHHYVFNGAWNGGERKFNVPMGQKFDLVRLSRIAGDGETIALKEGSLGSVDQYAWAEGKTLRWRSRKESDPPFENTELIYEIEYVLSRILRFREEDGQTIFVLDHDFAFAEREGTIEHYSLKFQLDDGWTPRAPVPASYNTGPLPPGESFPLAVELAHKGAGTPAAMGRQAPMPLRRGVLFAAIGLIFLTMIGFFFLERSRGRFDDEQIPVVDEAWLEKNVFFAKPEVIGALWDVRTGAAEVAAMIARLAQEKKIETHVSNVKGGWLSKPTLEMKLLVPRESFSEMERPLIDAFFVDGDTTSTEKIRSHYESEGFDPLSTIKAALQAAIGRNPSWTDQKPARWWRNALLLLVLAGFAMLAHAGRQGEDDVIGAVIIGVTGIITLAVGIQIAAASRNAIGTLGLWAAAFTLPTLIQLLALSFLVSTPGLKMGSLTYVAMGAAIVIFYWFVIACALFRESVERLAVRKRLRAGRAFFARELKKPQPAVRDEWLPYIMAFGLGKNVDRWFASFGGATSPSTSSFRRGSLGGSPAASDSQGGPGGSWSGGGSSFGGGGAGGAWAAAAGGLAAGVAAPSSTGGSGGGGRGSSSSGGGGGGGW